MYVLNKIKDANLYQTTIKGIYNSIFKMKENDDICQEFFTYEIKINKIVNDKLDLNIIRNFPKLPVNLVFVEAGELGKPVYSMLKSALEHFKILMEKNQLIGIL